MKTNRWIVMIGKPEFCGLTRKSARKYIKVLRKIHDKKNGYLYIGKCVDYNKRHCQIILDV